MSLDSAIEATPAARASAQSPVLRTPQAAAYLQMSVGWLKANRREKSGGEQVPFIRVGGRIVAYRQADLDDFLAGRKKAAA